MFNPNISGHFDPAIISSHGNFCDGAFMATYDRPTENHGIANMAIQGSWGYYYEAMLSNSMFGRTNTVQPLAIRYLCLIRF